MKSTGKIKKSFMQQRFSHWRLNFPSHISPHRFYTIWYRCPIPSTSAHERAMNFSSSYFGTGNVLYIARSRSCRFGIICKTIGEELGTLLIRREFFFQCGFHFCEDHCEWTVTVHGLEPLDPINNSTVLVQQRRLHWWQNEVQMSTHCWFSVSSAVGNG